MFVVFSMQASPKKAIGAETHAARYQSSLHRQVPLLDSQSCGFPARTDRFMVSFLWWFQADKFVFTFLLVKDQKCEKCKIAVA